MSVELAEDFFKRDLSAAELDALEASLADDPAVAERLLAGAEEQYRGTGLPEPRWDERGPSRGKGWLWLAALAVGGGLLAYNLPREARSVSVVDTDEKAFSVAEPARPFAEGPSEGVSLDLETPVPAAHSDAPSEGVPVPGRSGRSLGVVLRLREATRVSVQVLDRQGRLRRRLFDGGVGSGERRFEWDGLDDAGGAVEPGSYQVRISGPGLEMSKRVELRSLRR
jgi:hypothetical protein